jgi:hypothetical protein
MKTARTRDLIAAVLSLVLTAALAATAGAIGASFGTIAESRFYT